MHGNSPLATLYQALDCLVAIRLRLRKPRRSPGTPLAVPDLVAEIDETISCVRLAIDALNAAATDRAPLAGPKP